MNINLNAQCEYSNGGFENWVDGTLEIDTTGTLPANTIQIPQDHFSAIRVLLMVFSSAFENGTPEYLEYWSNGFGFRPDDDAFLGEKAMRIGGDTLIEFADVNTFIPCTTVPKSLSISFKHIGNSSDTLFIQSVASNEFQNPYKEVNKDEPAGYIIESIFSISNDNEYSTINIPFTINPDVTEVDTITTQFIVSGNKDFLANGGTSYFLIDNVHFVFEDSPTVEVDAFNVNVFPNPVSDILTIDVEKPVELEIFNMFGQMIQKSSLNTFDNQISCQNLESGQYIFKLTDAEKQSVFKKVIVE